VARHVGSVGQLRHQREQRRPKPTALLDLGRDFGRHALGVEVDQCKCRLLRRIDDVIAGSGDEVRLLDAVELLLGDDFDLVGKTVAERAERDRLIRLELLNQRGKHSDIGDLGTTRCPRRHHAGTTVAMDRAVAIERDAFGQRPARLGEDRDLREGFTSGGAFAT
jgi:hypothetical protein